MNISQSRIMTRNDAVIIGQLGLLLQELVVNIQETKKNRKTERADSTLFPRTRAAITANKTVECRQRFNGKKLAAYFLTQSGRAK